MVPLAQKKTLQRPFHMELAPITTVASCEMRARTLFVLRDSPGMKKIREIQHVGDFSEAPKILETQKKIISLCCAQSAPAKSF